MSVGRFVIVSIAVHVGLVLGARAALPVRVETFAATDFEISFALTTEALKPPTAAIGIGEDGIEPERTTGLPSGPDRGRAGDAFHGSAPAVHVAGATPRDRFAAGAEEVRALTGWVAEGIDASADGRSPFDATSALGARDEASLGVRGSSIVAPGERGLDMVGTGHGSCRPGEECAAGTIGDTQLGPGALGAAAPPIGSGFTTRGRSFRSLCITDTACRRRRGHFVLAVDVHGALARDAARRVIARHRAAISHCLPAHGPVAHMELFVAPDGHVARAVTDSACLDALAARLTLPSASGPSIVVVRASYVLTQW